MVNKAETRENDTDGNPLVIQIEVSKVAIWCYLRIEIYAEPSLGGISRTSLPYKNDDDERYTANHYALPLRQA